MGASLLALAKSIYYGFQKLSLLPINTDSINELKPTARALLIGEEKIPGRTDSTKTG